MSRPRPTPKPKPAPLVVGESGPELLEVPDTRGDRPTNPAPAVDQRGDRPRGGVALGQRRVDLRTFVHPEPADPEPMSTAVGTVPAAAAPVEPGSFSLCLEESGGYLCTRPVGHEDEHIASGVHDEHRHGGSVRWPQ